MKEVSLKTHPPDQMKLLTDLIATHEEWLMARVLKYAKRQNYTKYTSTLVKAWQISVSGLSNSLLAAIQSRKGFPELEPDVDYTRDPIATFGVVEARLHRSRGVTLGMFLGLMKYYRQSYVDLIMTADFTTEQRDNFRYFVDRFFDRVELGFCVEAEALLKQYSEHLEILVRKRTSELINANSALRREIEERKQMESANVELFQQLLHAQKMEAIGTMAGGIAHDFNNILTAILGFSELAQERLPAKNPVNDHLKEIITASLRAKHLVMQILTFRHKTDEQQRVKPDIIVREVLKLFRAMIPSSIQIHQKIETNCGYVSMAPTHIHQIIMNLCTNAYHAMKETGGALSISLKTTNITEGGKETEFGLKPGSYLLLTVKDTGHGMDETIQERIFEPYFTTKKEGEGTGLGLSVINGIIKKHHGYINVFSEPGKGSTFRIFLPRETGEEKPLDTDETDPVPKGSEHILIVDDEAVLANMWKQHLEFLGYRVTTFTNSPEALRQFKKRPEVFDLVMTDMNMPNITGRNLSRKLLDIRSDIPIILCTGYDEILTEKEAAALGVKAFFFKPVLIKELAGTIRKVLDDRKPQSFPMLQTACATSRLKSISNLH